MELNPLAHLCGAILALVLSSPLTLPPQPSEAAKPPAQEASQPAQSRPLAPSAASGTSKPPAQPPIQQKEKGAAEKSESHYTTITERQRLHWFVGATVGPEHLARGVASAALSTAEDDPPEYRGTWSGFGKRFGIREAGASLSNAMEAGLGSVWGEDPRYFPVPQQSFGRRVGNVIKQTFLAKYPDGNFRPAYARYTAITGSNFISDAWRAPSEANTGVAITRTAWGFLARMAGDTYDEFWPDVRRKFLHRR
jgi:hypothetical protein